MKKLALVLGSLLVVGSVASAKEVVPAPAPAPEVVVKVVEKPVVVYRDRVVEDTKWRPNGSVSLTAKSYDAVENAYGKDTYVKSWADGDAEAVHSAEVTAKTSINFTEKQNLSVKVVDAYGYERNHRGTGNTKVVLGHSYDFGKINGTEIGAEMTTEFTRKGAHKELVLKPVFDFSGYFFKNDYVKATALQLAPVYTHGWAKSNYSNEYALYANAEFELPYGLTFQVEFDKFFAYGKDKKLEGDSEYVKEYNKAYKVGDVKFALGYERELYKNGRHSFVGNLSAEYSTKWAWSKNYKSLIGEVEVNGKKLPLGADHGTLRDNDSKERWGGYEAKFEPSVTYTYAATEYVKLHSTLGAEYKNRTVGAKSTSTSNRHGARNWRWQPYAEVGFKATF